MTLQHRTPRSTIWRNLLSLFNTRLPFPKQRASDHYNQQQQCFFNTPPRQKVKKSALFAVWQMIFHPQQYRPDHLLPTEQPNWTEFFSPSPTMKFIWLGHSSLLIRSQNKTLLIDPIYSQSASPIPIFMHRFQAPPIALTALPNIDLILYTHAHYDHLDHEVVDYFVKYSPNTQYLTPLGLGTYLRAWGVADSQITELDWQENHLFHGINIHAVPARHYASRSAFDNKKSLWLSYVLQTLDERIYFSGDSTYAAHFKQIGQKFGGFDLAFIENGQYNHAWPDNHMFPEQSVQAALDLRAQRWVPIHWGAYPLAPHAWNEPIIQSSHYSEQAGLAMLTPIMGQVFDSQSSSIRWWQN